MAKVIKETMAERDKLKREKCFPEYKKLRNKVKKSDEKSQKRILPKSHRA